MFKVNGIIKQQNKGFSTHGELEPQRKEGKLSTSHIQGRRKHDNVSQSLGKHLPVQRSSVAVKKKSINNS